MTPNSTGWAYLSQMDTQYFCIAGHAGGVRKSEGLVGAGDGKTWVGDWRESKQSC
jgi:hypothetical protein